MTNKEFIESIRLPNEEWRDVVGYEGYYMVSSLGRVASIRTKIYYKNRLKPRIVTQHLIKLQKSKYGNNLYYISLGLCKNGEQKSVRVHDLVASAFLPNPSNYPCIDHIDTDGTNNNVSNLRWCTHYMNMMNPITRSRNKLVQNNHLGYRSKKVVFVSSDNTVQTFKSIRQASEYCKVDCSTITKSCMNKTSFSRKGRWYYFQDYQKLLSSSNVKELIPIQ